MIRRLLILTLAAIALSFPTLALDEADKQQGVVQIFNLSRGTSGSGFVINDKGYIATNHHVISKGRKLYVNPDGNSVAIQSVVRNPNARIVWASQERDLAILKVTNPDEFEPVTLAEILPRKGEALFAVGYPGAANQNNIKGSRDITSDATVTAGVLSRSYIGSWRRTPIQLVQHNAEISWGNSGGPLFDECRRVIGVNTRLSTKKIGKSFVVAPGAFFSSNVSELIKVLNQRNISYISTKERCFSREDQIQDMLRNSILIGIAAFVVLAALLVVALRRPREKVVQLVERYSRSMRGGPAGKTARASQGAARPTATDTGSLPRFGLTLDGYDAAGNSHKIQIDKGDLLTGVTVGREPPDSQFAIHNDEVSRSHASFYAKDGLLYVRDEGSTNGTFLNGRTVRPNYSEIAGNGDELKFGPVTMKILFR